MRGHRFVRPALILTDGEGVQRRLLAELEDKPWAAEDGESWRATFAVESGKELDDADGLELSVAPDVNVALRRAGMNAGGPITATPRVPEEPPLAAATPPEPEPATTTPPEPEPATATKQEAPADPDLPFPIPPRRPRARGVPAPPEPAAAGTAAPAAPAPARPVTPRPRPVANRAADLERLTARLAAAEATLEREQARRDEIEQALERERTEARRTVAELARVKAELELARTAESEASDTASQLDAARRDNHELRARHESLLADHDRALRTQAALEEKLKARTTELQDARTELSSERSHRRDADSRSATAAEAAAAHRPPAVHTPPPPRTDRPINPSLRRSPWLRLLVVLVIAGVLLAVYLVLHSTILH